MTPHIQAAKSDFAPVVLMPGDPLRAKWIAETFLTEVQEINAVRGMLAYTGYYQNQKISVMGHGMGNPSMGIYSYELFDPTKYDVQTIIRIGSCGSLDPTIQVQDVIIAASTFSESCYAQIIGVKTIDHVLEATPHLVAQAITCATQLALKPIVTRCYASDVFYNPEKYQSTRARTQAQVVEMEAFALYANAQLFQKQALCLLTVSDSLVTHESLSAKMRQTSFQNMVRLALEMSLQLA